MASFKMSASSPTGASSLPLSAFSGYQSERYDARTYISATPSLSLSLARAPPTSSPHDWSYQARLRPPLDREAASYGRFTNDCLALLTSA